MNKLLLLSLLIPFTTNGQTENSLLWKITGKHSKQVSYLFGTIHSNDSLINTFDQTWWEAYNSCSMVAGEVDMTNTSDMMEALSTSLMENKTLADFYSKEELKRVQDFILSKLDPMTAMMVGRMKPFYIMAALMELPSADSPFNEVMDHRIQLVASDQKKKIIGLESLKEQASSIDVISLDEQAKLLLEYVNTGAAMEEEMRYTEKFYATQNLDSLSSLQEKFEAPDKLMNSIVDERNDRFVKNLLPYLSENNVFCCVGALHLPGKSGLIAQLRREGYKLEPVAFKFELTE